LALPNAVEIIFLQSRLLQIGLDDATSIGGDFKAAVEMIVLALTPKKFLSYLSILILCSPA